MKLDDASSLDPKNLKFRYNVRTNLIKFRPELQRTKILWWKAVSRFQMFTKALFCFARRPEEILGITFLVANDLGVLLTSYVHEKMEPPFQLTQQQTNCFYQRLVSLTN